MFKNKVKIEDVKIYNKKSKVSKVIQKFKSYTLKVVNKLVYRSKNILNLNFPPKLIIKLINIMEGNQQTRKKMNNAKKLSMVI